MKIADKTRNEAIENKRSSVKENTVMTIREHNGKPITEYTKIENVVYKGVKLSDYIGALEKAIDTQSEAIKELTDKLTIVKDILVDFFEGNKKDIEGDGL